MRSPFSLYKKNLKSGIYWYARFFNPKTKTYSITRSTGIPCTGKKGRRIEAYKEAEKIAETIEIDESKLLLPYLESFWKEDSPYLKSKRIAEKKPVSAYYIELNASGIEKHVKPFKPFAKIRLPELTPGLIEDWKLWALEKGTGHRRVNAILNSMKVAVRYAVSRGELTSNPFANIKKVAYTPKEKGILTQEEVKKLIQVEEPDHRVKLAVLLAVLVGLRRGEVRGLRWKDIDCKNGILNIQNNYVDTEGNKPCKSGSDRQVILHETLQPFIEEVRSISPYTAQEDFVLFSLTTQDKPFSIDVIRKGFKRLLRNIGIPKEEMKKRNLTFHGMRHTFVTMARMAGLPDITVQALAGHKSAEMMNHYSHAGQVIDFEDARQKLGDVANQ